ncbi:helix-turn-helix domain-containing protein [Evansella cellulosilytica]|uniref:Transcriptional regulator, AraC family n=1 Tax=Evansella cellulosilytica (strain ATCC 21833 / DSM 2522 / FERM P-1141 / JCM 9156 / N-4) TaxID=649639 RepID=E6TY07_EVAC2|nr:helix-turn-helix domain-containing protein [Evansella cellulosilytica]ADU31220.1 transcriptional regulator, AraC family [Evansella cellulosilytica DSM 2522]
MEILTFTIPPLPTFITGGNATFRKGEQHFQRIFHIFDLIYVVKGKIYMKEAGEKYEVKEGQYIILAPGLKHGGYERCEEEAIYYWIHFTLPNDYELKKKHDFDWSNVIIKESTLVEAPEYKLHIPRYAAFRNKERGIQAIQSILELNDSSDPAEKMRQQLLFGDLMIQLQKDAVELPTSAQNVTDEVVRYIKRNYLIEGFTVKEMAQELLYHPDYITRSMKKVIGMTPIQFLNHYRLSMAKSKIIRGNHDLDTVARECGFSDVSYFSRIFKKKEGMTPGQYRRMSRTYEKEPKM